MRQVVADGSILAGSPCRGGMLKVPKTLNGPRLTNITDDVCQRIKKIYFTKYTYICLIIRPFHLERMNNDIANLEGGLVQRMMPSKS